MRKLNLIRLPKMLSLIAAAVLSLSLVACGKKDGGGGSGTTPLYPHSPCIGCAGNQQPLLIGVQAHHSEIRMGLDVYGDSNLGVNLNDPKAIVAYRGPLTIQGNAVISSNNLCGARGNYSLRTINPGTISWGMVSGSSPMASGAMGFGYPTMANTRMIIEGISTDGSGPNITIQVQDGQFYNSSVSGLHRDSQNNRLGLNFAVLVGGNPCGYSVFSTY